MFTLTPKERDTLRELIDRYISNKIYLQDLTQCIRVRKDIEFTEELIKADQSRIIAWNAIIDFIETVSG